MQAAAARLSYVRLRARGPSAGFTARPAAGLPSTGSRAGLIAAIVCEDVGRMFADSFFSRLLLGLTSVLPPDEVQLALLPVGADGAAAQRFLDRSRPDGVLMISAHGAGPVTEPERALAVPTVFVGRPLSGSPHSYVDVDNRTGARQAVQSLIGAGRRNVATIAGPQDMAAGVDRLEGYREAVFEAGVPQVCAAGDFTRLSGERAMSGLLYNHPNLDAVFTASDHMAAGALRVLRRSGRRVPDDVAVIGFDDAPFAAHTRPPLTTVRQPVEDMGAAVARQILLRMGDSSGPVEPVVFDTALVRRESS